MFDAPSRKRSDEMGSFISTCRDLGLPLNASKQLIHGLRASVLGGEIDGFNGRSMHSREKGMKVTLKTSVLFTFGQVSQTHVQHWCGLFCFASGFRRPLFSILQEVFRSSRISQSRLAPISGEAKGVFTSPYPLQSWTNS